MDKEEITLPTKIKRILIWLLTLMISGFFIISSLGWFMAMQMVVTGQLGKDVTEFNRSLSALDNVVRTSQVIVVIAASILLLLSRRAASKLFLIALLISVLAFLFVPKWGISFLPPYIVLIVYGYAYVIGRYGFLR
jgi:hypothetical protein